MAEAILYNLTPDIIFKLGSSALQELGSLWRVNSELHKLKHSLSAIQAVLLDAEEQQSKNNQVKDWVLKLQDVLYEIDDLIDVSSYETLRRQVLAKHRRYRKQVYILFSKFKSDWKIGHKIKEIRQRLQAINEDKNQFSFRKHVIERRDDDDGLRKRRETHSFILEDEVIGRNDDKEAVIDLLLNSNTKEDIAIVSIVGMGGLDSLQCELRKQIDGKKYFLVMDDVWNEKKEEWLHLKRLLMGGAKGSRILITTRNEQVAKTFDSTATYSLQTLDPSNSWLLFQKMTGLEVCSNNQKTKLDQMNSNLMQIGKEILSRLKGVPLVIRTIGGLLKDNKSERFWLSFKDKELYQVLGQEQDALKEMQLILELSYKYLPANLKQCFLYCALFLKDCELPKNELILLWRAQGFIQPNGNKDDNLVDIGDDYFMELLSKSFFQEVEKNDFGDIIAYLSNIEYIVVNNDDFVSSSKKFPSPEELKILNMPKLVRWCKGPACNSLPSCWGDLDEAKLSSFPASWDAIWAEGDDLKKLTTTVSTIKDVLLDAEGRQTKSHLLENWLQKLEEAIYDAENVLKELSTEALRRELITRDHKNSKQFLKRELLDAHVPIRVGMFSHVFRAHRYEHKSLMLVRGIAKFISFCIFIHSCVALGHNRKRTYISEAWWIPRDFCSLGFVLIEGVESVELLPRMLFLLIWSSGMVSQLGGIGKTTLAKSLYNDEEVSGFFDLKIWVWVSDQFEVQVVVEKMIESATKNNPSVEGMEALQAKLQKVIGEKKGRKVLITKRDRKVATEIKSMTSLFTLEGLSESNSWLLFECYELKELPRDINNLVNLRHLTFEPWMEVTPTLEGMEKLTCLQTISLFVLDCKKTNKLWELNDLSYFTGELKIIGLEKLRSSPSEIALINLKEKKGWQGLNLEWKLGKDEYKGEADETIMEGLEPHPNVESLSINGVHWRSIAQLGVQLAYEVN
ncbi:putative disease resistance RPP13-like protein 1 isoform X1 [Cucumis melo var. makuwa]|uniref:Disease resistance RPP13-like protein 1 isoform X1 n=1 Tax=Cucumis melo var. makuwa TaxID=1194695 RepID=A0A5A7UYQ1_CUCMM|nr:putative disease resistance RPP13-like protein 1 isoform X1 [Cucumis melo var. makuwa]